MMNTSTRPEMPEVNALSIVIVRNEEWAATTSASYTDYEITYYYIPALVWFMFAIIYVIILKRIITEFKIRLRKL